jgi:hypothetical protein
MTRQSHLGRYLRRRNAEACLDAPLRADATARMAPSAGLDTLPAMRVRRFELRLIALALLVAWTVAAALVLLAYRPGGPLDLLVGLTAMIPIAIALAAVVWPPVARGEHAFPAMVWLGILALLCLIPSIAGVLTQLLTYGSRTLLPSAEAAYPWILALLATSCFAGFGIVRRLTGGTGGTADRRRRLLGGIAFGVIVTILAGGIFSAVAVANDVALRDSSVTASRFGPTSGEGVPPSCDGPLAIGSSARLDLHLDATVDRQPLGTVELDGVRVADDYRWLAYVASDKQLGQYGAARIGDSAWATTRGSPWRRVASTSVAADGIDAQVLNAALTQGYRATAEDRGIETIDGARARRCRIAIDGAVFATAFPQVALLVGDADLHRWRGQLDYWVFLDGQLGQVAGSINGEGAGITPESLLGTIDVQMTATERGRDSVIYPPGT